ncbi:MAG TPA: hypothetical protein VEV38_14560 [Candidatus Eremiobacteraceae bacterium]|nr:hypothetical protein [Candidatus Eremiobacteraceae bacterium]
MSDYWSDKTVFAHVGRLELASVTYEVVADFTQPLPTAFSLKITLRGLGVYLGSTTMNPIANGALAIDIAPPIGGKAAGNVSGWGAVDSKGAAVPAADAAWKDASAVSFLITAAANVTLSVAAIMGLVPGLGWAARAALALFGSTVTVNIGHKAVSLPIHRDASGNPIQPN